MFISIGFLNQGIAFVKLPANDLTLQKEIPSNFSGCSTKHRKIVILSNYNTFELLKDFVIEKIVTACWKQLFKLNIIIADRYMLATKNNRHCFITYPMLR